MFYALLWLMERGELPAYVEAVSVRTGERYRTVPSSATVTTSGGTGSVDVTVSVDPDAMDADDGFFSQSESDGWLELTNQADADDKLVVGLVAVADPASQVTAAGGEDLVTVENAGPADGFADGFTHVGGGDGSLAAVGYRTGFVPATGFQAATRSSVA